MRTTILTFLALVAFAANSILCRLALGVAAMDAASFATLRLTSGALMLLAISAMINRGSFRIHGSWWSAAMLFAYAVPFSFAYLSLTTGTGALILFGSVQATMMIAAIVTGERPHWLQWCGLAIALGGLVWLVLPGLSAPPLVGSILMVVAGISWAVYTLRGRGANNPLGVTTGNFVRSVPLVLLATPFVAHAWHPSRAGILLAVASGALASALGYFLWYAALRGLSATRAAAVQLSVPVLAAAGGTVLLAEHVSKRLIVSAILILGGVGLALAGREQRVPWRGLATAPAAD